MGSMIAYLWPLVLSATLAAGCALYAWRQRRKTSGVLPFAVMMAIMALWSALYIAELATPDPTRKRLLADLIVPCYANLPIVLLAMALHQTGHERWLTRARLIRLLLVPQLTTLIAWTHRWHGLWRDARLTVSGPFIVQVWENHAWFWVHAVYSYAILLATLAILGNAIVRSTSLYRRQALILFLSLIFPLSVNILYVFNMKFHYSYDPTPLAFSLSGLFLLIGLIRYQLLETVPIAHSTIIANLESSVLVFDRQGNLLDFNPKAAQILPLTPNLLGQPHQRIPAFPPELGALLTDTKPATLELKWRERIYDTRSVILTSRHGQELGRLITLHDITERKRAEQETLRRNEELAFLNRIALIITSSTELPEILSAVARELTQIFAASGCGFALLEADQRHLRVLTTFGSVAKRYPADTILHVQEDPLLDWLLRMQQPIQREAEGPMPTALLVPLTTRGRMVGIMAIEPRDPSRRFTFAEIALAETLAGLIAGAIENVQLYAETRRRVEELAMLTDIGKALS